MLTAVKEEKKLDQGQTKQEVRTERHLKGKELKDSLLQHKISQRLLTAVKEEKTIGSRPDKARDKKRKAPKRKETEGFLTAAQD